MAGLLSLDPLTANQGMLNQAAKARLQPRHQVTPQGLLDATALGLSPVPVLGDILGLGADANRFINEPESRTPLNFGLAALGLLPFVPGMGAAKVANSDFSKIGRITGDDAVGYLARPKGLLPQKFQTKKEAEDYMSGLLSKGYFSPAPVPKSVRPSDDLLNAAYSHPSEIPQDVIDYIKKSGLLTSDATDAVRWSRIVDTANQSRYPNGGMTLYRATDAGDEIRPGDWVTSSREYAEDHLRRYLKGKGRVIETYVNGRDVLKSPTGNYEEAIFAPFNLSGPLK